MARAAAEPRRARRPAVAACGRASARRADPPSHEAAAAIRRHGHAAHADLDPRPLRPGGVRQLTAGELPQGGAPDGAACEPGRDLRPAAGRRRTDPAGSGARPRGELPLHADRDAPERALDAGVRHRAGAARRSRAERVDVCRARRGRDADRPPLGHRRRDRRAQGAAPRRRERRRDAPADRDRAGRDPRAHRRGDSREAGAQGQDSRLRAPRLPHRGSARHAPSPHVRGARQARRQHALVRDVAAHRTARHRREEALSERRLLLGVDLLHARHPDRSVHADLRGQPDFGLDGPLPRAVRQQPPDPAAHRLHRPGVPAAVCGRSISDRGQSPWDQGSGVQGVEPA